MIASFLDGRVRIRTAALRDPATMKMVQSTVAAREGVLETMPNSRTGSLLITYDPAKISRETLMGAAALLETQLGARENGKKRAGTTPRMPKALRPKTEAALLSGLFGLTLAGPLLGKGIHVGAGALMTLMAFKHMYDRRKRWQRMR